MLRMVKDKNKPKGPMSAYACFVQVIREEHKKKHPEESVVFSEFSKKCAEKWKTMTDKEKQRFDDMAARDKERYIREMDAYVPPDGVKKPRKRRRNKDPGQPKRALSAFFFFCEERRPAVRAEHPDWKVGDIAKDLGRQWEVCQCKGKYESQAIADKSRYEREMIEYKNGTFISTKRARLEDVISGETSGMTAAGNGYLMKPENSVYGRSGTHGVTGQSPLQPQTHLKPEMPSYDAQVKPEVPNYEAQVKSDIPGPGPSYGTTSTPTDGVSHPAAYAHQGFTQAPAQQPPPQSGMPQEPSAVALQSQTFGGMMAQDLSAPPQSQPTQPQLQQPTQPQQQQQPPAQPQQQPPQQPQQVPQTGASQDISLVQHHATPGGDTVDLSAERNGGSTVGVSGVSHGSNGEASGGGANAEEDEEDEEEEEEEEGEEEEEEEGEGEGGGGAGAEGADE